MGDILSFASEFYHGHWIDHIGIYDIFRQIGNIVPSRLKGGENVIFLNDEK